MKKLVVIPFLALLTACGSQPKDASEIKLDDFKQTISYALGADMGANFQNIPEEILAQLNIDELQKGFLANLKVVDKESTIECNDILNAAFSNAEGIDTTQYSMAEISNCYGSIFGEMLRNSLESRDGLSQVNIDIIGIGFAEALKGTDTLIALEERHKMVTDFNDDLNKNAANKFMTAKSKEFPKDVQEEGYILVVNEEGKGEAIDLSMEYDIVYTITNIKGDTIISTFVDRNLPAEQNSQTVSADDIVFPEVWKIASSKMKVGGSYTIYSDYDLAYNDEGLRAPNSNNYIIQPYSAIVIYSKVLSQGEVYGQVKERGRKVIEEAKKRADTYVDPSGYVLTKIKEGTGKNVPVGGDVKAHYVLTNSAGETVEDSYMISSQHGRPAPSFSLKNVIEGWQLAIPKMNVGGKYILTLPYDLAYGENGNSGIQPFETLTFEIEVLEASAPGGIVQESQQSQLTEEQLRQLQEQFQAQ